MASTKLFSCVRCFERKVKCDKQHPCAGCIKSNIDCVFRIPAAPRRKKRKPPEDALLARLKKAEELLQSKGVDLGALPESASAEEKSPSTERKTDPIQGVLHGDHLPINPYFASGRLIGGASKSRFVDNNLWNSVSDELPKGAMEDSTDDESEDEDFEEGTEFMLGFTPSGMTVQHLHPSPEIIFRLWQIFLENVNPMTKLVHQPTLQESIIQAATNTDSISRGLECLMFSIYCSAIMSINDEECCNVLGEAKKIAFARYKQGARRALARAKFLGTADIVVLQAFVLYLIVMREQYDSRTLWTLAGVANRIAQGMGIHKDGSNLGLPFFETEMRRRLWWQLTILDFRSGELTGSGRFDFSYFDSENPTNLNDVDFYPGMQGSPLPRVGATEMITCLLRCEFGSFWKDKAMQRIRTEKVKQPEQSADILQALRPPDISLEERDVHIDELEKRLEEKFLRYCDPSVPVQMLASIIGRAAINTMRFMSHHPRHYARDAVLPPAERNLLWKLSVKLLESDNLAHSSKSLKRFMWHSNTYFQWQALIHLLEELKTHSLGDDVDAAWQQVDEVFENHPTFITDFKSPLHVAIGSLCLKAYDAKRQALEKQQKESTLPFHMPIRTPAYVEQLRQQREALLQNLKRRSENKASTTTPSAAPLSSLSTLTPQTPPETNVIQAYPNTIGMDQTQRFQQQQQQFQNHQPNNPIQQGVAGVWPTATQQGNSMGGQASYGHFNGNSIPAQHHMVQQPYAQNYFDPVPQIDPTMIMMGSDNNDVHMDWSQWDYLLQDFDMPK